MDNIKQLPRFPTWKDNFKPGIKHRPLKDEWTTLRLDMQRAIVNYAAAVGKRACEVEARIILRTIPNE